MAVAVLAEHLKVCVVIVPYNNDRLRLGCWTRRGASVLTLWLLELLLLDGCMTTAGGIIGCIIHVSMTCQRFNRGVVVLRVSVA